jgi:hypothetical protein
LFFCFVLYFIGAPLRLTFDFDFQVVSGVHPGRCHLLPLKHSSRQAPPTIAADGSLHFSAKCGVKLRLLLQACDEAGAALTSGGDKFEAAATCLADGAVSLGAAVVEDNADGTYDISVCLSRTGLHSLTCQFGGCSVSGFPVNISVSGSSMADASDFSHCCAVAADINVGTPSRQLPPYNPTAAVTLHAPNPSLRASSPSQPFCSLFVSLLGGR